MGMSNVERERKMAETLARTQRTLPIALLRVREAVMDRLRPVLSAYGISEAQWRVLRVLQEIGHADASQLAQQACISPPSLTRILRNLAEREFLSLEKDKADGRRTVIELSPEGEALIVKLTPPVTQIHMDIEARLDADRVENFLNELEYFQTALSAPSQ
ncbi:homoprotocatechuate degradation operon regulator HpaR [Gymnodinialimonas sp. 57CJ19]|uniref:homoprotocatechuate degradation operon regulator HpaR n=1 Tax=Gymnodinialimonas sp. 57CJ19 TaxID=3138498 RepID=UPI0031343E0A